MVFVGAVTIVLATLLGRELAASWPEVLAFGCAAALAGLLSVRSGPSTALSLDMPVLLAAGLVFGPGVGAALGLVAYIDPREWRREISLSRAACNRGQTALSVAGGSFAFVAMGGELGVWPSSLLAGLLALATDIAINYLLVGIMTSLRTRASIAGSLAEMQLGPRGVFILMYFTYGLMSVLLAEATAAMGLKGFVTFIVPLALAKGVFEQGRQVLQLRRDSDQQLAALASATHTIADEREDERRVLAGELHDEVLPPLFKVHLMGQVIRHDLDAGRLLSLDDDIPELLSATESAQSAVRGVVRGLRSAKIGPAGLESSLRMVAQGLESAGSPRVVVDVDEVAGSEAAELLVYQLAREAMSNSAKHSKASVINVTVRSSGEMFELTVADDGVGFDPANVDLENHFGLSLIEERVKALAGTVDVLTSPGQGTVVHALIPRDNSQTTPG